MTTTMATGGGWDTGSAGVLHGCVGSPCVICGAGYRAPIVVKPTPPPCRWCSDDQHMTWHTPCPRVAAIEYHPDGTVKRVEFREAAT